MSKNTLGVQKTLKDPKYMTKELSLDSIKPEWCLKVAFKGKNLTNSSNLTNAHLPRALHFAFRKAGNAKSDTFARRWLVAGGWWLVVAGGFHPKPIATHDFS